MALFKKLYQVIGISLVTGFITFTLVHSFGDSTSYLQTINSHEDGHAAKDRLSSARQDPTPTQSACPEPSEHPLLSAWLAQPILDTFNTTFDVPETIEYDPQGPRPDQVVFVTAADRRGNHASIPHLHERTIQNRQAYCDHHGYHCHFFDLATKSIPGADPVWKKILAVTDAFNTYPEAQWVFVLDLDAIIMSPRQDLNSLILSEAGMKQNLLTNTHLQGVESLRRIRTPATFDWRQIDMIMGQDRNGLNAGAFFVRRSAFSQLLVDMWLDPFFLRSTWGGPEQEALRHMVIHHASVRRHFGLMRQRVANSYVVGPPETMLWQKGDLVVHFAGCWVLNQCRERYETMWAQREIL